MVNGYKYKRIAESLRQRIKNGGINIGEYLPTSKTLAKEYNTTAVTIDKAIGILVSDGLVLRTPGVGTIVQSPIQSRHMADHHGLVGALLQAQTESRYWERLLEGVSDILRPEGFSTLVGYHNQDPDLALEHALLFKRQGVEIILFAPFDRTSVDSYENDNAFLVNSLKDMGFQVIMLDRYIDSVPGHYISEYCYSQGRNMIESLMDKGFKNPICVSTDYVSVIGARERAFIDGCKSKGLTDPEADIIIIPLLLFQERKYEEIISALQSFEKCDLFICMNSRIFNTLIYLMARKDSRLFKDNPKMAGFVDIELIDLNDVVAYVEQPVREMGHAAGRMVKHLLFEESIEYQHSLVPCELRIL